MSPSTGPLLASAAFVLALSGTPPVAGQSSCGVPEPLRPEDVAQDFFDRFQLGCFGQTVDGEISCFGLEPTCEGEDCLPSICERIADWEGCWDVAAECNAATCGAEFCDRREEMTASQVEEALVRESWPLFGALRQLAARLPDEPDVQLLRQRLRDWEQLLASADVDRLPTGQWQPQGLILFADDDAQDGAGAGLRQIDGEAILERECVGAIEDCRSTFERLGKVWTLALSHQTLLRALQKTHRDATVRYLVELDRRWRSYLLGGRSLFPWERWVNGEIHRRRLDDERGFVEPPARQLLLLHPEAAYEYRDSSESDGLEEVLTLELVGFYRWRWGEDAAMIRPWGGSLIVNWDGRDEDSVGYGVMAHLPRNWSLGVVVRPGAAAAEEDFAVLLAVDLPRLFVRTAKLRERLQDLRLGAQ